MSTEDVTSMLGEIANLKATGKIETSRETITTVIGHAANIFHQSDVTTLTDPNPNPDAIIILNGVAAFMNLLNMYANGVPFVPPTNTRKRTVIGSVRLINSQIKAARDSILKSTSETTTFYTPKIIFGKQNPEYKQRIFGILYDALVAVARYLLLVYGENVDGASIQSQIDVHDNMKKSPQKNIVETDYNELRSIFLRMFQFSIPLGRNDSDEGSIFRIVIWISKEAYWILFGKGIKKDSNFHRVKQESIDATYDTGARVTVVRGFLTEAIDFIPKVVMPPAK